MGQTAAPGTAPVGHRVRAGAPQRVDAADRVLTEGDHDLVHRAAGVDDHRGVMGHRRRACDGAPPTDRERATSPSVSATRATRGGAGAKHVQASGPFPRGPLCRPPGSGCYGETPANRRTAAVVLAHDPSGQRSGRAVHSCGSAPVLHRLPPPRPRDLPGSGTTQTIRGLRDRCRAGTLEECVPRRQPPDPGIPWPGSCGRWPARRPFSWPRAPSTWPSSSGSRGSSWRSTCRTVRTGGRSPRSIASASPSPCSAWSSAALTTHFGIDVLMTLPGVHDAAPARRVHRRRDGRGRPSSSKPSRRGSR